MRRIWLPCEPLRFVCKATVHFSFILTLLFRVATDEAKLQNDGLAVRYREVDAGRAYG